MESLKDILKPIQEKIESRLKIKQKWLREGVTMTPNIVLFDSELSMPARLLYCCILAHAFNKGRAFPPNWLLQVELGISEPQVIKYKKELEGHKIIKVIRTGRANNYEIDFDILNNRIDKVIARLNKAKEENTKKGKNKPELT